MELKWIVFYKFSHGAEGFLEEFSSKEVMNCFIASLESPVYLKVISGYILDERKC